MLDMVFRRSMRGDMVLGTCGQVLLQRARVITLGRRGLGQVGSGMHPLPGAHLDAAQSHVQQQPSCIRQPIPRFQPFGALDV